MLVTGQQWLSWRVISSGLESSKWLTLYCHVRNCCVRYWCHHLWFSQSPAVSQTLSLLLLLLLTAQPQLIHCRSAFCLSAWFHVNGKRWSSPVLVTEHWARNWSRCTGSQPAGDFLSHSPVVGYDYFLPGLRSLFQLKNITVLRPVLSYTAWWQRHTTCPGLLRSFVPVRIERLSIASPTPYRYATAPPD